jgi:hypothetical protein
MSFSNETVRADRLESLALICARAACPRCGKQFRLMPDKGKRAVQVIEETAAIATAT